MELKFPYGDYNEHISIADFTMWKYTIRSTTSLIMSRYDSFFGKPIKIIINDGPMDEQLVNQEIEAIKKKYQDDLRTEIVFVSDTADLSNGDVTEIDVVEPVKYVDVDGKSLWADEASTIKHIVIFKRHNANVYFNALREITLKLEGKMNG